MVKHIQRIHGKPPNGSFTSDCPLLTAQMEHLAPQRTADLCPDAVRNLGEPVQNVKFVSHSVGNVLSLLPSVSQNRASAPYLVVGPVHQTNSNQTHLICSTTTQSVTNTTCILPVTKTVGMPHNVAGSSHAVSKVTQNASNPPNIMVNEADHRIPGKISLGKSISLGALPRVHVAVPADHAIQQKTLIQGKVAPNTKMGADSQLVYVSADRTTQQKTVLQSQVGAATGKIVFQSKALQKDQIALAVGNNTHLRTLLSNPMKQYGQKAAEARNLQSALPTQRPVHTGVIQNIQVAHAVQRSVPPGAHPSMPVERFGQGAPPFPQGTQNVEKAGRQRMRPNILVRQPVEKLEPSGQSSVQVELLAPLNQPIEHNRPLTVSCPEEITIPAGCLVELVEVKNVNGTRELELRLVPQNHAGPQLGSPSLSTTADSTASRLSFKCKVSTDDQARLNHGTNSSQTHEQQVKGLHLKEPATVVKVDVKDEAEAGEQVLCSKMSITEIQGSSSGGYYGVLNSVARASELHKVTCQASTGLVKAAGPVTSVNQMHCRGGNLSQRENNGHITRKVRCKAAQASSKHDVSESSYQGLPVISSVFSLCPSPEATRNSLQPRVEVLDKHIVKPQTASDSGSESLAKVDNSNVCTLKTEVETGLITEKSGQKIEEDNSLLEETKVYDSVAPEKTDDIRKSLLVFPSDSKDTVLPGICSTSTDVSQTANDPSPEKEVLPLSETHTVQNKEKEEKSVSESTSLAQRESPLASPLNPTVALARIPSLDFYSLVEFSKKGPERPVDEESVTARPVLCCTSDQQNMQERAIKLVLKRKRPESGNKDSGEDQYPLLAHFVQPPHKKHKKEKRKEKIHKPPKVVLNLRQIFAKDKMEKLWLTPLKDDQPVKLPAPNQPVVVLNHPSPPFQMVSVGVKTYSWISSAHGPHALDGDTPAELAQQCPSFKMKLKKVQGQTYQVTELVLKGVAEKMVQ